MNSKIPDPKPKRVIRYVLYDTRGGEPCNHRAGELHISEGNIIHVDEDLRGEFPIGPISDYTSIMMTRLILGNGYAILIDETNDKPAAASEESK